MSVKQSKKAYPPIYEKAVPVLLGTLAVLAIVMVIASLLVVFGVFR